MIRELRVASKEEWTSILNSCTTATFFQSPEWYKVWAGINDFMISPLYIKLLSGKEVVFPLGYKKIYKGLIKDYIASPAGTYGGLLSSDELTVKEKKTIVKEIYMKCKNLSLRINPLEKNNHTYKENTYFKDTTEILFLSTKFKTEGEILYEYKHSARKQIKKGIRNNLVVEQANHWSQWESYYQIYKHSIQRWGSTATNEYKIDLFKSIYELKSSKTILWLVLYKNKIIGGNLNFYQNNHCVEWHAAFDSNYFNLGTRNFLVHKIIWNAIKKGFKYYDFNPSGDHEGTQRFKQTFGTSSIESGTIRRKGMCMKAIKKIYK